MNKILNILSIQKTPDVNHIKVYLNGTKCSEYTLSDNIRLSSVIPNISENVVYKLNYFFKSRDKLYFSMIYDYYVLKIENDICFFKWRHNHKSNYLDADDDYELCTDGFTKKLTILETDKKFYCILILWEFKEKYIYLVTKETINIYNEVKKKLYLYQFEIADIEYDKTSYVKQNFDFHTVKTINQIVVHVNAVKRNLLDRFIYYLKHK